MFKYEYELKRSSRRSIGVRVNADNTLIVYAPYRASLAEIERFLNKKLVWIERCFAKNNAACDDLDEVIALKAVLVSGKINQLRVGEPDGVYENAVCVRSADRLKKVFIDAFGGGFLQKFESIRAQNNFVCNGVGFKDYKAKWGCCDERRRIIFNYKLLMLPENIQRYVIVHELCHTVHMDHSAKFYALVSSICPDYKLRQKELKKYGGIIRLY